MGPLPGPDVDVEKLRTFFSVYHWTKPIICRAKISPKDSVKSDTSVPTIDDPTKFSIDASNQDKPFNLDYMTNSLRVFSSFPVAKDPKPYHSWLTKVEKKKAAF